MAVPVTLNDFEVIVVFSSTEHLGLAAEALGCSVSKVQRSLHGLENKLHVKLLDRDGRRLRLTNAGWALAEQGGRVLRARSDAVAAAVSIAGKGRTALRIGHTFSLGIRFVPQVVAAFIHSRPGSIVSLRHGAATTMTTALLGGHIDAAFSSSAPIDPDIAVVPLFQEGVVLAAPSSAALPDSLRISTVAQHGFVAMPSGSNSRGLLLRACARAGFAPTIALEADDLFTLTGAVAAGVGLALLPAHMTDLAMPGVKFLRLAEPTPTTRTVTLSYRVTAAQPDTLEHLARIARRQSTAKT